MACVANRTQRLRALNKPIEIPSTEDLVKLINYVDEQMQLQEKKNKKPSYDKYLRMAYLLIVRITIFNKRRISEVNELPIADFY